MKKKRNNKTSGVHFHTKNLIPALLALLMSGFSALGQEYTGSFSFLNYPSTTKAAGLGGRTVSQNSDNPGWFLQNPASVNVDGHHSASLDYIFMPAGIGISQLSYGHSFYENSISGAGLTYFNYGTFEGYNDTGIAQGDFKSHAYVLYLSHNHSKGPFRMGTNLKYARQGVESYKSSAVLVDLGGLYVHPTYDLSIGLAIKNMGWSFSNYTTTDQQDAPLNIDAGVSFKPAHMPVRFHGTAQHISQSNLLYDKENNASTANKVLSHLSIGIEGIIHKNFQVLLGYNHLLRKELKPENGGGLTGFSYGFSMNIKKFEINFARRHYHVAGASNSIGIVYHFNHLIKRSI